MEKVIESATGRRGATTMLQVQRPAVLALVLCVLFVALDWLTYVFPARFGITPFNPEGAVAIALLTICGVRYVPLVFLAAFVGEYWLPVATRPLALIVSNSAILAAGYAAVAYLLVGRFNIRIELDTRRDVLHLMAVTLTCMLMTGVAYVSVLISFDIGPAARYFNGVRRFFIGHSVGILVAAPLLLMLFSETRRLQFMQFLRSREAWAQIAAIAACVWWVFLQEQRDHIRFFYLFFLPLIWSASRFGMVGAASALVLIEASLLVMVSHGGYRPLSMFELQLLFITLAITGLLLGVSMDEQQRAAAAFRGSLKLAAAGEMAAAITHEINQPLTALSGYARAGQLIAAAPNPDRALLDDTMRKLIKESKRASAVVRRLRDFFRSGSTRLERVTMIQLASHVIHSMDAKARAAHVTLNCRTCGDNPLLLADPLQIEMVLRNILANAIDSAAIADGGGTVEVEIEADQAGEVVVMTRDSGSGIREGDAERLFESFVTTKTFGMGMGLAISRAIVEAHGGRIWAVPGEKGILCFSLPTEASSRAATNA